jgi:hypothetical protein
MFWLHMFVSTPDLARKAVSSRFKFVKQPAQCLLQPRQVVFNDIPYDLRVDLEVVMDENVTHANDLRLWNICRSLPHLLWHSPCRFADDLQVSDDPILDELIPLECGPPL